MALRPAVNDFLHNNKFQVFTEAPDGSDRLLNPSRPDAGFMSVTPPEITVEAVEYQEGTDIYPQQYPGRPTWNDITMSQGVARSGSSFWRWIRQTVEGSGDYRVNLRIAHYHRNEALNQAFPTPSSTPSITRINTDSPSRVYRVYQAFPIRYSFSSQLESTSSDISVSEMDVKYEYADILEPFEPAP